MDDLASEARPGSLYDLLTDIEDICRRELAMQCGMEWTNLLAEVWFKTRTALQQFALNVDPHLTLLESSALERFDALWVAVAHKRDAIVSYLMNKAPSQR